jgi:hypothetical protein
MLRIERFAPAVALAFMMYAGCSNDSSKVGGETHWLAECASDADCGGDRCLCGMCTRVCNGDGDCSGSRSAECYAADSPGLANRCASMPPGTGVCLGTCSTNADCPPGDSCFLGACVASVDAGANPAGPSTGEIATKYVHRDAGSTFGAPVDAPTPSTVIVGDGADALVGTWFENDGDGGPCVPGPDEQNATTGPCLQLDVTKDASHGGVVGHVFWLFAEPVPPSVVQGPFPPVSDPSVGYPPGVEPAEYAKLTGSPVPRVSYSVLDGRSDAHTFSFWVSENEVWADWCALQSPLPFLADGFSGYRCVPQSATEQNTDLGKFILCSSPYDDGVCPDPSREGDYEPCICLEDGGRDPRCRDAGIYSSMCDCTASRCAANLHLSVSNFDFQISGTTMIDQFGVQLTRVTP